VVEQGSGGFPPENPHNPFRIEKPILRGEKMAKKQSGTMGKKQSSTISKRMQRRAEQRRKKRQTQIAIAAVVVVILAGVIWAIFGKTTPATNVAQGSLPASISVEEAYQMYEAGDFFLDVRTQEEWDEYRIPGATHIPLEELAERVDEVPRDQNVVVVCRTGNRSQEGRDILLKAGFTQVTSMDNGISAWREAGYPTE
jgi:rhodanese-related sulfurtransferase